MKLRLLLRILSGLVTIFFTGSLVFGQASFSTKKDGNWSLKTTWQLDSGVPALDSIPHAGDNVTIRSSYDVTVNVNAACNNLTISNGAAPSLDASIMIGTAKTLTVNGTLTWGFDATHPGRIRSLDGGTVILSGPVITTSGTRLQAGHGTIVLSGSSTQTLSIPTTIFGQPVDNSFYSLTISNASGVTFLSDATVKGTLTLSSGNVDMGTKTLRIDTSGSVSRTSGHVIGSLQKFVDAGAASLAFQIGDASNYTPVDVSFGSVTSAGYLTARTTIGDHLNISTSPINETKSVNRYWTLTNTGVTFSTYDATFNFVVGDLDPGVSTDSVIVGKYDGSTWSSPAVGAKTSTSTQATGLSSFSDFAVGEEAALVAVKVFLQGPYSGGSMTTALNTAGVIPTTAPYTGSYTVGSIPSGVVDWVLVELRSDETTPAATRAAFLKSDGSVVDTGGVGAVSFSGVSAGSYYIVIRHRNHIAIMSATAVALSSSSTLYNFTTSQSQAYGTDPMALVGTSYAMIAGDVNGSGVINAADRGVAWNERGLEGYVASDVNLNGVSNAADRGTVWNNRGSETQVP